MTSIFGLSEEGVKRNATTQNKEYQHRNCLTYEKADNVFSIYIDHYERPEEEQYIFVEPQAWKEVFEPLYNILAFQKFDEFDFFHTDNDLLREADHKTRKNHYLLEDDGLAFSMGNIQLALATIEDSEKGHWSHPVVEEKEYYRFSKSAINMLVEFGYNIVSQASKSVHSFDQKEAQEWMIKAKANYERCGWSELIGQNKKLVDLVGQAQTQRMNNRLAL